VETSSPSSLSLEIASVEVPSFVVELKERKDLDSKPPTERTFPFSRMKVVGGGPEDSEGDGWQIKSVEKLMGGEGGRVERGKEGEKGGLCGRCKKGRTRIRFRDKTRAGEESYSSRLSHHFLICLSGSRGRSDSSLHKYDHNKVDSEFEDRVRPA